MAIILVRWGDVLDGKALGRREFGEPNTGVTDNYILGGMHLTKVQELTG